MRRVCCFVLLGACGRLGFETQTRPMGDAPNTADALGPCVSWGPFGTPVLIAELAASGDDWAPRVTGDELEIYWYSSRSGTLGLFDIFGAQRTSPASTWGPAGDIPQLSSTATENNSFVSEDGLTFIVATDRPGGLGQFDLWISTRASRAAVFSPPTPIPNVQSAVRDNAPWLSPDGLRLYFTSDRGVGASIDIYVATRTSPTAAFGTPTAITELDSPQNERDMTLSHDELEIFIASDRSGDFEIYRSSRPDLTTPFSPPLPVAELDTANDELGPTLSADGATVYFNYNTNSQGGANSELFFATRPCLAR